MTEKLKTLNSLVDSLFRINVEKDSDKYDADVVTADDDRCVWSEFPVNLGERVEPLAVINHIVDLNGLGPKAVSNITRTIIASGTRGATATIFAYREANTGGHHHGSGTRSADAVGRFSPSEFVFRDNYPQNVKITHTLPDVAGSIYSGFTTSDNNGAAGIITIGFAEGFVTLSATKNLHLKAPTKTHRSPYWVTPAMRMALNKLADGYSKRTKRYITITDASLQYGGLFDHKATWHPPHDGHKDGQTVDIRNRDQNDSQRKIFVAESKKAGLSPKDHGNHWHVRLLS